MNERRSLIEGLKSTPALDPQVEKEFVFQAKSPAPIEEPPRSVPLPTATTVQSRAPISTRIRADLAAALKRASLERQLSGTAPNTLQDILEEAIEPWLKSHGYVP